MLRAQQLWDELAEISGEAVFERTGVINLGPASSAFLANVAACPVRSSEVEELDAQAVMQRWPEYASPDYRAIFEPASGVLRSELAVETWIRLARDRLRAAIQLSVSAVHHHADGITIDTLDGEYHGKSCWSAPAPGSPACFRISLSSRYAKVFAWYQADGRYSSRITSRPSPARLPNGDQYYGFRRKIMN